MEFKLKKDIPVRVKQQLNDLLHRGYTLEYIYNYRYKGKDSPLKVHISKRFI